MTLAAVDALLFDVFGTVVDWRSGVVRDGERLGEEKGLDVDWAAFADAWREEYQPSMERVRQGEIPWRNLDALHRESLEGLLDRFGVEGVTAQLDKGERYRLQQPNGQAVTVTVVEVTPEYVKLDANHPLAGKELTFDLELVGIEDNAAGQNGQAS